MYLYVGLCAFVSTLQSDGSESHGGLSVQDCTQGEEQSLVMQPGLTAVNSWLAADEVSESRGGKD